jgi:hypothetical protein
MKTRPHRRLQTLNIHNVDCAINFIGPGLLRSQVPSRGYAAGPVEDYHRVLIRSRTHGMPA